MSIFCKTHFLPKSEDFAQCQKEIGTFCGHGGHNSTEPFPNTRRYSGKQMSKLKSKFELPLKCVGESKNIFLN